jgi:pimeloyl-ACP methyl ester carboxylesterase
MSSTWDIEGDMVVRVITPEDDSRGTMVWIHGLGEWSVSFDAIAQHPQFADYTHVLPDLPGYGRSPWSVRAGEIVADPGGSVAALADHLAAWLGLYDAPILVGHSMGGVIATLVAEQQPVRAVINVDGNLTRGDCTFSAQAAAYSLDEFRATGFAAMREAVFARGATEPALRGYHAAMLAANADMFHANAADLVRVSTLDDLAPRFAALRVPALFVAGVPSGICEASRSRLDEVGARWTGVSPAGHWPFVDQPDVFAAAVADFLASA